LDEHSRPLVLEHLGTIVAAAAALIAYASLRWQMGQRWRQREQDRAVLEARVAETERKLTEHLAEVAPLKGRLEQTEKDVATTKEKTANLTENVNRLVERVDYLIDQIMEWRRNGGAKPA
jgi:chromosome segregation ATPase